MCTVIVLRRRPIKTNYIRPHRTPSRRARPRRAADGIGFGVTHSMVTMMFENSLQLVNPMVSLPYWDFTIEGSVVDTDEEFGGDYTRLSEASPLWGPDWFGGVDKHDYQVGFFTTAIVVSLSTRWRRRDHLRTTSQEFDATVLVVCVAVVFSRSPGILLSWENERVPAFVGSSQTGDELLVAVVRVVVICGCCSRRRRCRATWFVLLGFHTSYIVIAPYQQ